MDQTDNRAGTRINIVVCLACLAPIAILLALSEEPALSYAIVFTLLGALGIARVIYGRARMSAYGAVHLFEVASAATVVGAGSVMACASWDVVTALFVTFTALAVVTGFVDQTNAEDA